MRTSSYDRNKTRLCGVYKGREQVISRAVAVLLIIEIADVFRYKEDHYRHPNIKLWEEAICRFVIRHKVMLCDLS